LHGGACGLMGRLSNIWKLILNAMILFAVCAELCVNGNFRTLGLAYFSIQSNLLVLVCLVLIIAMPKNWSAKPMLRGISLLAIILTCIVYNFGIYNIFSDWGTDAYAYAMIVLHIAVPVAYVLDWIFFDVHGSMNWSDMLAWGAYPLCYCCTSIVVVQKMGHSIYFFFDASNGSESLALSLILLVCLGTAVCVSIIGMDKFLALGSDDER